jgi:ABC-type amino acid transport substrate-binding protein
MGIALKKSNQQLVQKIEQLITALKKDGELSRLETTWGLKG